MNMLGIALSVRYPVITLTAASFICASLSFPFDEPPWRYITSIGFAPSDAAILFILYGNVPLTYFPKFSVGESGSVSSGKDSFEAQPVKTIRQVRSAYSDLFLINTSSTSCRFFRSMAFPVL